ncbi:hypothetical protein [Streptomyces sp. NPDC059928]|uniref:hypothetical protein n=1 Tax=unclassified Streptomyces TaxID=2593676 RepID=UPI003666D307
MTQPPAEGLLFDVPVPPTPVERLLILADHFTRHNDTLDLLPSSSARPDLEAPAASARHLADQTRAAIKAVGDQQLYQSAELIDAVVRLKQLAYLSGEAARHLTDTATIPPTPAPVTDGALADVPGAVQGRITLARELTALAPEAAVESATRIAREIRRRRPPTATAAAELTALQHSALQEIVRGHIAVTESLGRQYVHSRDTRVLVSTLRSLEAKGLITRAAKSAPPAYYGGPPPDRVRLTTPGTTALAARIGLPPATPTTAVRPALTPPSPARTRR